jgi:hypothetical protein
MAGRTGHRLVGLVARTLFADQPADTVAVYEGEHVAHTGSALAAGFMIQGIASNLPAAAQSDTPEHRRECSTRDCPPRRLFFSPMRDEHDDELDEGFPLGDGTADTTAAVTCPYCGELSEIALDPGSGASQEYVEDCPVCCRPWRVVVSYHSDGTADARAEASHDVLE